MQRNPPCLEEARTSTSQGSIRAKVGSHFLGLQSLKKAAREDGEVKSQAHGFRPCLPFHQAGRRQREAHFFLSEQISSPETPTQIPPPSANAEARKKHPYSAQGLFGSPVSPGTRFSPQKSPVPAESPTCWTSGSPRQLRRRKAEVRIPHTHLPQGRSSLILHGPRESHSDCKSGCGM